MEELKSFTLNGHLYFWAREADRLLVWDSSDTLIGSATPDMDGFLWILEDAEGIEMARLSCWKYSTIEALHEVVTLAG